MKKLPIAFKLYAVWGTLIALALAMGLTSVVQLRRVGTEFAHLQEDFVTVSAGATAANTALMRSDNYAKAFADGLADQDAAAMRAEMAAYDSTLVTVDRRAQAAGQGAIAKAVAAARASGQAFLDQAIAVENLLRTQGDKDRGIQGKLRVEAHELERNIKGIAESMNDKGRSDALMVDYLMLRRHEKDFLLRHDPKYVANSRALLPSFRTQLEASDYAIVSGYVDLLGTLAENVAAVDAALPRRDAAAAAATAAANDLERTAAQAMAQERARVDAVRRTTTTVVVVMILAMLMIGGTLAVTAVRGIVTPLRRAIGLLDASAGEMTTAAAEVSSASQTLAAGAAEQAASIQESASSLEQVSAATGRTAGDVDTANELMGEAGRIVASSLEGMTEVSESMAAISQTSEETRRIVKTIDEIAFQTNLLALNAAVEAARAGDAGKGFAVVAEEVRNLAGRAATAARDTTRLIDESVNRVTGGAELVERTRTRFDAVAESAGRVAALVQKIAKASREQSTGVDQVTAAVGDMDGVVQQNAASAEESAAAAEEMTAHAEQLRSVVHDLVGLVDGERARSRSAAPGADAPRTRRSRRGPEADVDLEHWDEEFATTRA